MDATRHGEINVIEDITIIEQDVEKLEEDCNKIDCAPIYQAIKDGLTLIVHCLSCLFKYCKPKKE